MDVTRWLLRHTPPRPLVVSAPGGTGARVAVERAVRERGWREAMSPAEANILVVAGDPGPAIEPYVQQVWSLVPAPRVRVDIAAPADVPHRLDSALPALRDPARQRTEAARPAVEHAEVPMADRADDRDGLKLDQLHVPLGPLLPLWPAGLIVHTRLQGDVIQHATVELPGAGTSWWTPERAAARRLDSTARLLALAGWPDAASVAQRLRDQLLDHPDATLPRSWTRRVRRSRTLRWLLSGVGSISDGPGPLAGDALSRLHRWLDAVEQPNQPDPNETQWTVDNLPALLTGTELATARLVVASLDPDLDLLARHEARHG